MANNIGDYIKKNGANILLAIFVIAIAFIIGREIYLKYKVEGMGMLYNYAPYEQSSSKDEDVIQYGDGAGGCGMIRPEYEIDKIQPYENEIDGAYVEDITTNNEMELDPKDLLPTDDTALDFDNQFPTGSGSVAGKNFLLPGHNIGINTIGSSKKNSNLQIRSDPVIPIQNVGPWNQSTIMPSDILNRRSFNVGEESC
jgi:hypothetical protein